MSQRQESGRYLFFDPFLCWPALQADPVEKALIQKIVAEPDDDLPRLIYADWLEERGDSRGDFIRLQCELASCGGSDEVPVLDARLQALWAKLRQNRSVPWRPLGESVGLNEGPLQYRRGIPAVFVRDYWTSHGSTRPIPLAPRPDIVEIPGNGARHKLQDAGVQALLSCVALGQPTHLSLFWHRIRTPGAIALANSPCLQRLESLDLHYNKVRVGGLKTLLRSPNLPELRLLDLSQNLLGQAGLQALHRWMSLPKLETLYLYGTGIGQDDLDWLRRSPRFQHIQIYP